MAFTEFYCGSGGSNLNSGSDAGTSVYTSTSGNYSSTTHIFTPTDNSNPATASPGAAVGQYASVYINGATIAVFIARITAVQNATNGTITLSSTIRAGAEPTTSSGNMTIKVGGVWLGPNGATAFPMSLTNFLNLNATASTKVRLNLKNNQTYTMTAGVTTANGSVMTAQGYTSAVGDGGRATIDFGTTTGNLWTTGSASRAFYADLIFVSSATSGTGNLIITTTTSAVIFYRCVAHGARNAGFNVVGGYGACIECEAYDCNKANTSSIGGFYNGSSTTPTAFIRCISHDNASGVNAHGFWSQASSSFQNCIADTNAGSGFSFAASGGTVNSMESCDAYNNGVDGITSTSVDPVIIENCNLVKNTGWGINCSGVATNGVINNCAYGSGTQANGSGTSTIAGSLLEAGAITYASGVTPWTDPANGDFRINLAAANFVGRGAFTETAASYAGTVGFPDIGAAQSKTGTGGTFTKATSHSFTG